jgi:hypothetical protein
MAAVQPHPVRAASQRPSTTSVSTAARMTLPLDAVAEHPTRALPDTR